MTKTLTPRQLGWVRGRLALAQIKPSEAQRLVALTRLAADILPDERLSEMRERLCEEVRAALPAEA